MAIQQIKDYIQTGLVEKFTQPGPNYRFAEESVKVPILIPGHVYTFVAKTVKGNDGLPSLDDYTSGISNGSKPYIDNYPIFISLGSSGPIEFGLNIKIMPQQLRRKFIQTYLKRILPVLSNLTDDKGEFIEYSKRIRQPEMNPFGNINKNFIMSISPYSGIKFEFLVDKYNREEMRYLSLIDWPNVPKIGEVNYSRDESIATRSQISDFLK
jgi:hypothetical protein